MTIFVVVVHDFLVAVDVVVDDFLLLVVAVALVFLLSLSPILVMQVQCKNMFEIV